MLGQPRKKFLQIVAGSYRSLDQAQHPGRILFADAIADVEVEVDLHDAERLSEFVIVNVRPADRHGLIEYRERISKRTVPLPGDEHQRGFVRGNILFGADRIEPVDDLRNRDTPEVEALTAGQNRGEDLVRLGRRKDEEHVRWRLLQRLQQRVEGRRREHVYLIDDVHFLPTTLRGNAHRVPELANVVDAVVRCGVDFDDVKTATLL